MLGHERGEAVPIIPNRGDALTHLLDGAKRFPMLTMEREHELALAWRNQGDEAALRDLVGSHLRLVIKIARGFRGYGLPIADLVSEGNVGLMQAAQKFDPDRGFRFATYAMWWISSCDRGVHPALHLDREDGHDGGTEEALL